MAYKAIQMQAPEGAEVMGAAILSWFDNLEMSVIQPILSKHGLKVDDVKPDGWYPFAIFNDIYREVYESAGGKTALIAVGKASARLVVKAEDYPGGLEQFITERLPKDTRSFVRNVPEDYGFFVEKVGEHTFHATNNTNIPNDLMFGYLWETSRILKVVDRHFVVSPLTDYYNNPTEGATFKIEWSV